MKKQFCSSILAAAFLWLGSVHGQDTIPMRTPAVLPPPNPTVMISPPAITSPQIGVSSDARQDGDGVTYPNPGVSSWLAYPRYSGCCCRVGGCGPIDMELVVRSGGAVPLPFGLFGSIMKPGFEVEGGLRSLFFNTAETAAWTAELTVLNMNFNTTDRTTNGFIRNFRQVVPSPIPGGTPTVNIIPFAPVSVSGLNDTTLNLALGRECYIWGSTHDCKSTEWKWRVGLDSGGSWGSNRVDIVQFQHKTSTIGGFFGSLHSDWEKPCGCALFYAGIRVQYGFLWSNVLQKQNDTNLQTLSGLLSVGLRY
jgi:hypothetical protein